MSLFKVNLNSIKKLGTVFLSVAITSLFTSKIAIAQQDFEKVEIETVPVREDVYMLVGEGGNIGVGVTEKGVFLIDDQYAPLTKKILAAVKQISEKPILFLINTHYHLDHTGGNENIGALGVVIIAHDNVPKQMSIPHSFEILGIDIPAANQAALPVITFNDTTTLHLKGNKIYGFHVPPAHTDGDIVIHFQDANVIHSGDIHFNGVYPFIDLGAGGSIDGMIAAVNRILPLCDDQTLIIPGHGPLSNRQKLLEYRNMLETVRNRVKNAINQGVSLEDFLKSRPTADLDPTWGKGFVTPEQFLTIVYTDLST